MNDFSIEADYVFISEHEDGKKTYTFWSKHNDNSSWYLENYVLNEQDNGVLDAYIIRYDRLMATHQGQIMVDDIKNHMELEYQGQLSDNSTTQRALYCPKVPSQEYVWIPGVTCTKPSEHHEYGEPCKCGTSDNSCEPAEPGFYIIQMVLLPTDCGGGGASPGGGVGPGSSPISTGPYNPIGGGGIYDLLAEPCKKIKKTFTKNSSIKTATVNLATQVSDNVEHGFSVMNNVNATSQNPTQELLLGSYGAIYIPVFPTNPYIMIAHTHNSPATSTYSVPSWEDMNGLSDLIHENPNFADIDNFMFLTITPDGTQYAFMIDDILAFKNYFYKPRYHISDYDYDLFKNWEYNRAKYYYGLRNPATGKTDPPKILENSTNKEQDLKYFMEIANNAGMNVFEMDANFNTFTQISITNNQIKRTPCK